MSAVAAVGTGRRPHPVTPSTGPASGLGRCAGGARAPRIPGVSGFRTLDPGELTTPITHREVERKVRVPADFELPPLGGIVPGVTDVVAGEPFTMVAAYHDTHDLRLIRWGATLRRREGGPDEGWHLKLPVADEEPLVRDEIALSLDAGDVGHVPSAIADLVRALVREAPMVHVVTVRTRRAPYALLDGTGVPVAELVDDRVEVVEDGVVVRSFREIEVEARSGPSRCTTTVLDTVAAALVASGGTPGIRSKATEAIGPRGSGAPDVSVPPWPRAKDPASETIRCVLATNVQAFLLADVRVRRNLTDSVHQMRVAARTLRSALRTFAPLVDDEWSTTLRAELRSAAEALATLRDTEVHLARLETHAGLLPLEDREHAVRVLAVWLRERLAAARAVADAELRSERHLRLLTDLVEAARDPRFTSAAHEPAGDAFPPLVRKASRKLAKAVERLSADSSAAEWHRARILAKRARYAADATAPVLGKRARRWGEALVGVTDLLGDLHDSSVAQQTLRDGGVVQVPEQVRHPHQGLSPPARALAEDGGGGVRGVSSSLGQDARSVPLRCGAVRRQPLDGLGQLARGLPHEWGEGVAGRLVRGAGEPGVAGRLDEVGEQPQVPLAAQLRVRNRPGGLEALTQPHVDHPDGVLTILQGQQAGMRLQACEVHLGVAEGRQGLGGRSQLRSQCRRPLVVDEWGEGAQRAAQGARRDAHLVDGVRQVPPHADVRQEERLHVRRQHAADRLACRVLGAGPRRDADIGSAAPSGSDGLGCLAPDPRRAAVAPRQGPGKRDDPLRAGDERAGVPPGGRPRAAEPDGLRPPDARRGAHPAQRVAHLRPTRRRRVVDDTASGAAIGRRGPGDPPRHRGAPRCRGGSPGPRRPIAAPLAVSSTTRRRRVGRRCATRCAGCAPRRASGGRSPSGSAARGRPPGGTPARSSPARSGSSRLPGPWRGATAGR